MRNLTKTVFRREIQIFNLVYFIINTFEVQYTKLFLSAIKENS